MNRSRGRGPRGRGRGYFMEYPSLNRTPTSTTDASSSTAKDALLTPEQYTPNSIIEEIILYIEQEDEKWMTDPWEIKRRYLSTQQFPTHFDQYRYIYESVLIETASMKMKHTLHDPNRTTSPITYSKTTIRRILSISQWGIHPHATRTLTNTRNKDFEVKYSYWDYVDAFTKVFYYQNPVNNHTWFIRISPEVLKTELPIWFLIWYEKCGI